MKNIKSFFQESLIFNTKNQYFLNLKLSINMTVNLNGPQISKYMGKDNDL